MTKEVKRREVERFLRRSGWRPVLSRGGHTVWAPADGGQTLAMSHDGVVSAGVIRHVIATVPGSPQTWR